MVFVLSAGYHYSGAYYSSVRYYSNYSSTHSTQQLQHYAPVFPKFY
jgi:hypothetical protein